MVLTINKSLTAFLKLTSIVGSYFYMLCFTMVFTLSSAASANSNTTDTALVEPPPLSAFKASYQFQWQSGVTLKGEATRQLITADNQPMSLTMTAKVFAASMQESSQFSFVNGQVSPNLYTSQRQAFFRSKKTQIVIDQINKQSLINQKNTVNFITKDTIHDNLSMQMQLQLDVKNAYQTNNLSNPFQYVVTTGSNEPSLFEFHYQGMEKLKVPYGEFDAIKLKRNNNSNNGRSLYIWLAPALDYQILRILQIEADDESFELSLKNIH